MKFLFNWLRKKLLEDTNSKMPEPMHSSRRGNNSSEIESKGLILVVYRASGGHVIECRMYNKITDRHDNKLHIITDNNDLGEELGRIITYENLRS